MLTGISLCNLGGCPRIENLLRKSPFWPVFPIIFVTRINHLTQMIKKTDSKWVPLATVSILGQPPRARKGTSPILKKWLLYFSRALILVPQDRESSARTVNILLIYIFPPQCYEQRIEILSIDLERTLGV